MRTFIFLILIVQLILTGCSPGGSFHSRALRSTSVTVTDPFITPNNRKVVSTGPRTAPHVLGNLVLSETEVIKENIHKLILSSVVQLKDKNNKTQWSGKVDLNGIIKYHAPTNSLRADMFPVHGDKAGEYKVRSRITCLDNEVCNQLIVEVYLIEGKTTHAAQVEVILETDEQMQPKDTEEDGTESNTATPTDPSEPEEYNSDEDESPTPSKPSRGNAPQANSVQQESSANSHYPWRPNFRETPAKPGSNSRTNSKPNFQQPRRPITPTPQRPQARETKPIAPTLQGPQARETKPTTPLVVAPQQPVVPAVQRPEAPQGYTPPNLQAPPRVEGSNVSPTLREVRDVFRPSTPAHVATTEGPKQTRGFWGGLKLFLGIQPKLKPEESLPKSVKEPHQVTESMALKISRATVGKNPRAQGVGLPLDKSPSAMTKVDRSMNAPALNNNETPALGQQEKVNRQKSAPTLAPVAADQAPKPLAQPRQAPSRPVARPAPAPKAVTPAPPSTVPQPAAPQPVAPKPATPPTPTQPVAAPQPAAPQPAAKTPPVKVDLEHTAADDEEDEHSHDDFEPSIYVGTLSEPSEPLFEKDRLEEGQGHVDSEGRPRARPHIPAGTDPFAKSGVWQNRPVNQVVGAPNKGSLENASDFLKLSTYFSLIDTAQLRHFGSFELWRTLEYLGEYFKSSPRFGPLVVNDTSKQSGGQICCNTAGGPVHKSHQNGLDADISYPNGSGSSAFVGHVGNHGNGSLLSSFPAKETWATFKALWALKAKDKQMVDRLLVNPKIKPALCQEAERLNERKKYYALLRQIRPTTGHYKHFHLRITCTDDQPRCRYGGDHGEKGDGCPDPKE